ncbi:hypothetical protein E8D34_15940 [Nocardioides sp. GY 10113]|uniref:hypothetical protein n=1 Tax=Nocardioides sp. GY 10113 TaxID=2569761 RepID=UPI0010A769C7|nr:hypothetical protein [Nocardioides sp. GY 10113]TIC83613.1 hypothetical protein E8D34_15940 [Nocardioides sp. GY 10113]
MSFVVTRAPRDPKAALPPPRGGAGETWALGMYLPGFHDLAWGESAADLVAALLGDPDYETKTEHERLVARILRSLRLQVAIQAQVNATAMLTGDWAALQEWERHVLSGPRHIAPNMPDGFPTRPHFSGADVWDARTPLVCVTTACEPLNPGVPPILGKDDNVWVIDPVDDESLLGSLQDLGLIQILTRVP